MNKVHPVSKEAGFFHLSPFGKLRAGTTPSLLRQAQDKLKRGNPTLLIQIMNTLFLHGNVLVNKQINKQLRIFFPLWGLGGI